jgi:hypothetical protein
MRAKGFWPDLALADPLDAALRADPGKIAVVGHASAALARRSG